MIVTDHNVQTALTYLAEDPHPLAEAIYNVTKAENAAREVFAWVYLSASGAAETRKQIATIDADYVAAKEVEAKAIFDRERHRTRKGAAESLLEIYRTENANARAAERIR